ncbi:hypothetical protein ACLOJK_023620 [Asimina triloba]
MAWVFGRAVSHGSSKNDIDIGEDGLGMDPFWLNPWPEQLDFNAEEVDVMLESLIQYAFVEASPTALEERVAWLRRPRKKTAARRKAKRKNACHTSPFSLPIAD